VELAAADARSIGGAASQPDAAAWDHTLLTVTRQRWLIGLRWLFALAASAALLLEGYLHGASAIRRPMALWVVIAGLAAINVVWTLIARRLVARTSQESAERLSRSAAALANAQVAVDLFILTLILRFSGGVECPLAIFYVFHMAIGALLLGPAQAVLQGIWAMVLYAGLAIGELQGWLQPHFPFDLATGTHGLYRQGGFVAVMVATVSTGILGTLYFTLHIADWLRERERQLRDTNTALMRSQIAIQDLQARRSRFMRTAAHQLKGPLATIQTMAGLLVDDNIPPTAVRDMAGRIVRRCGEALVQVDELLTLARVKEADPARHRGSICDAGRVMLATARRFKPLAEGRQLHLQVDVADNDLRIRVDPRDLEDCLGNIVDNAIKYTQPGGQIWLRASIGTQQLRGVPNGDWIRIDAIDTGMGFDPHELERQPSGDGTLFDAFHRGNNALAAGIPGSGLGLAIVQEVMEQVGGRVLIASRPGQGTHVTLLFPSAACAANGPTARDTRATEMQTLPEGELAAARRPRPEEISHA